MINFIFIMLPIVVIGISMIILIDSIKKKNEEF